ncbi:MAG: adenylate/guanylate cyclase domain-containing protein [Treponema sp.]|nr:adenylate/guanylate cyclase domain-containing protein [Treponema sp.]
MKIKNIKIWKRAVISALICALLTLFIYLTGLFTAFENKTYDQRMLFSSRFISPNDNIVLITVDQQSIDWAGETYGYSWPWPREAYAHVIDFLSQGNPSSIMFDILFTEPSVYGEEDDQALCRAEKESGKVVQTLFVSEDGDSKKGLFPLPSIMNNAAILGNITSCMDKDDIIRRGRLSYEFEGKTYPTLGTAPLFLQGKEDFSALPLLKDDTVLLRYQKNLNSYIPYSIKDILSSYDSWKKGEEGIFLPEDFEDAYVFIAYYAPGLFDICSVPVSQVYPGVGVHITTLDNYLSDSFIKKTPALLEVLFFILLSFIASLGVSFASLRPSQRQSIIVMILTFFTGIVLSLALPYLLFIYGIWLQLAISVFAFLLSFIVSTSLSFAMEGKQKRFIKSAFSQCLSKEVVNQIMNDPSSFTLGGKTYNMTAIFTDIEKFSSFSELLTARQLGSLLNYYLTFMSDIIISHKGTVDKYEGDAIVAFCGAPVEMPDHAKRACAAAIEMKKAEIIMNQEILEIVKNNKNEKIDDDLYEAFKIMAANKKKLFTRIGINSGEMIAGYFGSKMKKNYTMMGNNVNLASRLEGVNKQYSTGGILISEQTRKLLDEDFLLRKLDRVQVVNVNTPVRLYELIDSAQNKDEKLVFYLEKWDQALDLFEKKDYASALNFFTELSKEREDDMVCRYYIRLIEKYFIKGKYPLDSDNEGVIYNPENGVFTLMQK